MLESFTHETFRARIGEQFLLRVESHEPLSLELTEATVLACGSDPAKSQNRRKPFSVIFRGPNEFPLVQHTYPFEHSEIGTFEMFIVPIKRTSEGMFYEAIFT